jgi:hypothetical protein
LSIIRGPKFLQRHLDTEVENPEPEADGTNRLELDGDTGWETESSSE